jgi:hypothetical protein
MLMPVYIIANQCLIRDILMNNRCKFWIEVTCKIIVHLYSIPRSNKLYQVPLTELYETACQVYVGLSGIENRNLEVSAS